MKNKSISIQPMYIKNFCVDLVCLLFFLIIAIFTVFGAVKFEKNELKKHIFVMFCIQEHMQQKFDDDLLPDDFEQIAKAYSKKMKNKGFVFVSLKEEEFNLLVGDVFVILFKMQACLNAITSLDSKILKCKISECIQMLKDKFFEIKEIKFVCKLSENDAFLALISLENLLVIKLMLLSTKSGELEVCNNMIVGICSVFAESFSTVGFELE